MRTTSRPRPGSPRALRVSLRSPPPRARQRVCRSTAPRSARFRARRRCSAARSAFGGYVELPLATSADASLAARPIAPPSHWACAWWSRSPAKGARPSARPTACCTRARTSPYYASWVELAPTLAAQVRDGILSRDLARVGAGDGAEHARDARMRDGRGAGRDLLSPGHARRARARARAARRGRQSRSGPRQTPARTSKRCATHTTPSASRARCRKPKASCAR